MVSAPGVGVTTDVSVWVKLGDNAWAEMTHISADDVVLGKYTQRHLPP